MSLPLELILGWTQGAYYAATGLWALVSVGTFMKVTGPKTDTWLVKTVGVLVLVEGLIFMLAASREAFSPELVLLAVGSAAGLAGIDIVYAGQGRISKIYLLDAVAEILLVIGWTAVSLKTQ